ncbi:uncharacterized protein LOC141720264 [Apium graveolens]|uniref:uncharacterized protein LOC141720264 n=1 Tax=Apium graveolens TaxID=4045 RepID=UPI003D799369
MNCLKKKTQALEAEIDRLKSVIESGGTFHSPMPSEKASFDPEKDKEMKSNPPPARGVVLVYEDDDCVFTDGPTRPSPPGSHAQRSCELSVERLENKVAFGMVYPREDNLTDLVHGVDIPIGHQCVSVDGLIKPDALLPAETRGDDMMTVRDALGSFLAWPEELISYTNIAWLAKTRSCYSIEQLDEVRIEALFANAGGCTFGNVDSVVFE